MMFKFIKNHRKKKMVIKLAGLKAEENVLEPLGSWIHEKIELARKIAIIEKTLELMG